MSAVEVSVRALAPNVVVYQLDAREPGPTALIQAGIHGDEIGGVYALEQLLEEGLAPARGRLLVIPRMNPAAVRARTRAAPGGLDLNRCFPGEPPDSERRTGRWRTAPAPGEPRYEPRLAGLFMALVTELRPTLVATLHESQKRYDPAVVPSFGQTLVYGVSPCPSLYTDVVAELNETASPAERWATHYYPVATSSTEVIVDAIGCHGVCVETWMGFPLERRIEMQRAVVLALLRRIGSL